ncbi:Hypothetical predicted protein [Scomber scombrus]|uniref:Uncharacterized protein n=1 Tax=Scomber scombrus TaxID=13677 RepID=A0AAV1MSV3_SCOSC
MEKKENGPSTSNKVRLDLKPALLVLQAVLSVRLIPSEFDIVTSRGNEEDINTTTNHFSKSSHLERNDTLCKHVCVCFLEPVYRRKHRTTQILAPGLKCEKREAEIKERFELNEH